MLKNTVTYALFLSLLGSNIQAINQQEDSQKAALSFSTKVGIGLVVLITGIYSWQKVAQIRSYSKLDNSNGSHCIDFNALQPTHKQSKQTVTTDGSDIPLPNTDDSNLIDKPMSQEEIAMIMEQLTAHNSDSHYEQQIEQYASDEKFKKKISSYESNMVILAEHQQIIIELIKKYYPTFDANLMSIIPPFALPKSLVAIAPEDKKAAVKNIVQGKEYTSEKDLEEIAALIGHYRTRATYLKHKHGAIESSTTAALRLAATASKKKNALAKDLLAIPWAEFAIKRFSPTKEDKKLLEAAIDTTPKQSKK